MTPAAIANGRSRPERRRATVLRLLRRRWARAQAELGESCSVRIGTLAASLLLNAYLAVGTFAAAGSSGALLLGPLGAAAPGLALLLVPWIVVRQTRAGASANERPPEDPGSPCRLLAGTSILARIPLAAVPWLVIAVRCEWIGALAGLLLPVEQILFLALVLAIVQRVAAAIAGRRAAQGALVPASLVVGAGTFALRSVGEQAATLLWRVGIEAAAVGAILLVLSATLDGRRRA